MRRKDFPVFRMTSFEVSAGAAAAPIKEPIRIAGLGEFGLTFTKDGGGTNIDIACLLQVDLYPDPEDEDPKPELQAPPFG